MTFIGVAGSASSKTIWPTSFAAIQKGIHDGTLVGDKYVFYDVQLSISRLQEILIRSAPTLFVKSLLLQPVSLQRTHMLKCAFYVPIIELETSMEVRLEYKARQDLTIIKAKDESQYQGRVSWNPT